MRRTLAGLAAIIVAVAALSGVATAATGGPDAAGYTYTDTSSGFQDISGTGTDIGSSCDDCITPGIAIGFQFPFYGAPYAAVNVSSNGNLQFDTVEAAFSNTAIPSATFPGRVIAPWWDDLQTNCTTVDAIYSQTVGAPGSRRLIVQWNVVPHFNCQTGSITFQAVLYEATGEVLFAYADAVFDAGNVNNNGASATVGIQNNPAIGLQYSFNSPVISDGQAICFRPPGTSGPPCDPAATARRNPNVSGAIGGVALAAADQARENRERANAAAQTPAQPVSPPRTGTGSITPPSTGDAGLADRRDGMLVPALALGTLLLTALASGGIALGERRTR